MFVRRILFTSCYEAAYLVLFIRTTCKQGAVFFGRMAVLFCFHLIDFECESSPLQYKNKVPEGTLFHMFISFGGISRPQCLHTLAFFLIRSAQ